MVALQPLRSVDAGVLAIAYHGAGPADGPPVLLMHGFPYDIHAYAEVVPRLVQAGCRVVVPYLRGYGPTRFLRDEPDSPDNERKLWYQYYFHSERGREGLCRDRRGIARLLWRTWSPTWRFDDATFERTAAAFDNPDFVDVVIHSYRHRYNLVAGDPAYAGIERRLAPQPPITVPTITFDGADDGVRAPSPAAAHAHRFTGKREHHVVPGVGHNMPQEAPSVFADAVLRLVRGAASHRPSGRR